MDGGVKEWMRGERMGGGVRERMKRVRKGQEGTDGRMDAVLNAWGRERMDAVMREWKEG